MPVPPPDPPPRPAEAMLLHPAVQSLRQRAHHLIDQVESVGILAALCTLLWRTVTRTSGGSQ